MRRWCFLGQTRWWSTRRAASKPEVMGWACSSPSPGSSAHTVWPTCGDGPTSAAARGLGNTTVDNETSRNKRLVAMISGDDPVAMASPSSVVDVLKCDCQPAGPSGGPVGLTRAWATTTANPSLMSIQANRRDSRVADARSCRRPGPLLRVQRPVLVPVTGECLKLALARNDCGQGIGRLFGAFRPCEVNEGDTVVVELKHDLVLGYGFGDDRPLLARQLVYGWQLTQEFPGEDICLGATVAEILEVLGELVRGEPLHEEIVQASAVRLTQVGHADLPLPWRAVGPRMMGLG